MAITNKEIASVLEEAGRLIELTGGNTFRARAFTNAARTLGRLDEPVTERLAAGTLTDLDGIGKGLVEDVRAIVETGSFPGRDELLADLPEGLPDLLDVKGLGTKKVRAVWKELGVESLDELEEAARSSRLTDLDGFGPKTRDRVLEQIELLRSYRGRVLLPEGARQADLLEAELQGRSDVDRVVVAGSVRRAAETVERVDLVAETAAPREVAASVADWFRNGEIDSATTDVRDATVRVTGRLERGLDVAVAFTRSDRFGTELWRRTGSEEHLEAFRSEFGTPEDHAEEEAVYSAVGLAFVPPELREGCGELDRAGSPGERVELIEHSDLVGSIHVHTTYSDGAQSIREMAEAARRNGRSYLVISDHSRSLRVAGGLSIEDVRAQREEIADVNDEMAVGNGSSFRIFHGIESDVLADGSLDYPEDVLASFDVVIASVHSRFEMTRKEATDRLTEAVSNPYTDVLGHPTGRLLLRRKGYPIDHERVIAACADHGVALEVNANPRRFDLDWRWIRTAIEAGVPIAVNPDAHSVEELQYEEWGVRVARKGGLTAEQCVNAWSVADFGAWLSR